MTAAIRRYAENRACAGDAARLHRNAKLTADEAAYAKTAPLPTKQIARELGVCPKTIREIRQNVNWRWL